MRLSPKEIETALCSAIHEGRFIPSVDKCALIYDTVILEKRVAEIFSTFPSGTLHAVAIKANPLEFALRKFVSLGCGLEAATIPELELALNAGAEPASIVYDSPTKSKDDLRRALEVGCIINADSLQELKTIDSILAARNSSSSLIGLRVNPQVGQGTIASTSVAGEYSKFGVPLRSRRSEILEAYERYDWLSGLHFHVGSQACDMDMLLAAAEEMQDLLKEIEHRRRVKGARNPIRFVDIGGGLPVEYLTSEPKSSIDEYAKALLERCPTIFNDERKVITEFGRLINANSAFAVSEVEYVKEEAAGNTAMIHLGADMFLRECYRPEDWPHEFIAFQPNGRALVGLKDQYYNVAGPLCFAGDIVGKQILLPNLSVGDLIVVRDSGAYTLSMWSRYNSRQTPKVIAVSAGTAPRVVKEKETIDSIISFWRSSDE